MKPFAKYLTNLPKTPLVEAVKALYESVEDTALTPFDDAIDIAKDSYDRSGGMDYEPEEGEDEESKYTVVKNTVDCIYGEMEEQLKSKGTVTVYRALSVKEAKDIRMDYLGESWSLYEDTAIEFGSHNGSNFILKAEAGLDAIDLTRTWEAAGACADLDEYEVCIEDTDRMKDLQIGRIVKRTAVYEASGDELGRAVGSMTFSTIEELRDYLDRAAYGTFENSEYDQYEQAPYGSLESIQEVSMEDFVKDMSEMSHDIQSMVGQPIDDKTLNQLVYDWFVCLHTRGAVGWQYNWN